jgi:hypothetical protein
VKHAGDDLEISSIIVDKLATLPGISYAEIASTAYKAGRIDLATNVVSTHIIIYLSSFWNMNLGLLTKFHCLLVCNKLN